MSEILRGFFPTADVAYPPPTEYITRLLSEFWLPMLLIFIVIPAVVAVVVLLLIKRNIGRR